MRDADPPTPSAAESRRAGVACLGLLVLLAGGVGLAVRAPFEGLAERGGGVATPGATDALPPGQSPPRAAPVRWETELAAAQAAAGSAPLLLCFEASWFPKERMDDVYDAPPVRRALRAVVPVRLDVEAEAELAARFGVDALPHLAFVDATLGRLIPDRVGPFDAATFQADLAAARHALEARAPANGGAGP
ncbi:MAG: hypothetical protein AAGH15_11070 [Myxococcota bacterium]